MDPNNSKIVPRESTPPPPYTESPGIFPSSDDHTNDHTTQQQIRIPAYIIAPTLGPNSCLIICPSCLNYIITRTDKSPTNEAYLFCLLMCVVGCILCACLPFFMNSCHTVEHICPQCGSHLGTYKR